MGEGSLSPPHFWVTILSIEQLALSIAWPKSLPNRARQNYLFEIPKYMQTAIIIITYSTTSRRSSNTARVEKAEIRHLQKQWHGTCRSEIGAWLKSPHPLMFVYTHEEVIISSSQYSKHNGTWIYTKMYWQTMIGAWAGLSTLHDMIWSRKGVQQCKNMTQIQGDNKPSVAYPSCLQTTIASTEDQV